MEKKHFRLMTTSARWCCCLLYIKIKPRGFTMHRHRRCKYIKQRSGVLLTRKHFFMRARWIHGNGNLSIIELERQKTDADDEFGIWMRRRVANADWTLV